MIRAETLRAHHGWPDAWPKRRMHILVVTGCYAPDRTGIAPLNTELCEYLASRGHQVSVVTGLPHYPEWRVPPEYRGKLWHRETVGGVTVYRSYIYVPAKRTLVRRILYDSSIGLAAAVRGLPIRDVDLILGVSPPLQAGLAGHLLARLKGAPLLFQVQDLVPDLAIALGMLRNRWAIRLARALEEYVYRHADAILVIGEGFRANLISKGVPESKIFMIPNWVDTCAIRPGASTNGFREAYALDESCYLSLHSGNMGTKQKLENVLEAAALLRASSNIRFLLVGDGADKARLEAYARSMALSNVQFLPLQPRDATPGMFAAADVLLLNQSAQVVDMVIPSKLLTYMAAGRPVIAAVAPSSEAAACIRRAGCGVVVPPEDPAALAQAICRLHAERELAVRLGQQGRSYAETHYARDRILNRLETTFVSFAEKKRKAEVLT